MKAMNEGFSQGSISSTQIYDGGNLSKITAEELKGNLLAIRQLINNFNEKSQKLEVVEDELADTKGELEYQNTYPFITTFAAVFNVAGTILVGVSVNQITSAPQDENTTASIVLLVLGGVIVLLASISTILYKWGRKWCNKKICDPS